MHQYLRLLATDLAIGEQSHNYVCPFCGGGVTKEASLNIKRVDEGLLYICYRASCGNTGFIPSVGRVFSGKPTSCCKKPNPYERPLRRLNTRERRWLMGKYRLRSSMIEEFRYSPSDQRVAMPVKDFRGYIIGLNLRYYPELASMPPENTRKAMLYLNNTNVPLLHFETHRELTSPLVVVEDQLSAKRINEYVNCVALLGCNLTESEVQHLLSLGVKNVYIALDGDAWSKAYTIRKKYLLFFRNFNVLTWSESITGDIPDPKDMSDEQVQTIFGDLR